MIKNNNNCNRHFLYFFSVLCQSMVIKTASMFFSMFICWTGLIITRW